MKKGIYTCIICLLVVLQSQAQINPFSINRIDKFESLGDARYQITYAMSFVNDPNVQKDRVEDTCILEIGDKLSKTYSRTMFEKDSTSTAHLKRGAQNVPRLKKAIIPVEVFKNYPEEGLCMVTRRASGFSVFKYVEELPTFGWKMHPEHKEILSYKCQLATTTFRGREYEAWFTHEIPLSEGPGKFRGLPGLIMHIQDSRGDYIFECINITTLKQTHPIKLWELDYQTITREEYQRSMEKMYKRPYEWIQKEGIGMQAKNPEALTYPYNPLELK